MIALLLACAESPQGPGTALAADYAGPPGVLVELAPAGSPDDVPLLLRISEGSWELRNGEDWDGASMLGRYRTTLDDGLRVDGEQLLPPSFSAGTRGDGVTVTAVGEVSVYYGTFPDGVEVEVDSGRWAGAAAFALDLGPIALEFGGVSWELVYYQRD